MWVLQLLLAGIVEYEPRQAQSIKCPTNRKNVKRQRPEDDKQSLLKSPVSELETVSKKARNQLQHNKCSLDKQVASYVASQIATIEDGQEKELLKDKFQC